MDDGIELNFAAPSSNEPVRRHVAVKKGGRWTDRVKAKREARDAVRHGVAARPEAVPYQAAVVPRPAQPAKELPPPPVRPRNPVTGISAPAPPVQRVAAPSRPVQAASIPSSTRIVSHSSPSSTRDHVASPAKTATRPTPASAPIIRAQPSPTAGPSRPTHIPTPQSTAPKPKTTQIISSLFTSGPSGPKVAPTRLAERPAGAPSNAPLGDTSTFAGLGLHPLLDRHLKGKMGVSAPTAIQRSCLPYLLSSPLDLSSPDDEDDDYETRAEAPTTNGKGKEPMRDVFIQSQTGSGKTLSYLLPIIQTLLPLSQLSYIDRSIGTLAIILAPTRELAQQISKVLEALLTMSLASTDQADDQHYTRWLVSGLLTGGSTKNHEKTRLRKGVPILVATPGRLLDHLQNTSSFKCAKTMFLVLDEADRLMDLGFEETITGIVKALDGRRKIEMAAENEVEGGVMKWAYWSRGRTNILCSATIDAKVEKLAGVMLRDPVVFRGQVESAKKPSKEDDVLQEALVEGNKVVLPDMAEDKFTPPSQLSQKYVVVPTKLRLVSLVALLRSLVAKAGRNGGEGTKVIVFLSSTDTVDFHWKLLGGVKMGEDDAESSAEADSTAGDEGDESMDEEEESDSKPNGASSQVHKPSSKKKKPAAEVVALSSPLLPNTTIHRLHGSLPLRTRLASLASFAGASSNPSILLATSVASRGLDLPLVRAVVQYDLPTEGGANEYVHRVGRTARAGKGGEAWAFVGPSESDWVPWVEGKMGAAAGSSSGGAGDVRLGQVGVEEVLKRGFGGRGFEYETRATEAQLALERWVLAEEPNASLARKAFASFVRAYSTHPAEEKRFFHPKSLHLGHLAKAFALREAPSSLAAAAGIGAVSGATKSHKTKKRKREEGGEGEEEGSGEMGRKSRTEEMARNETERRMYEAVRKAGRMSKAKGVMGQFDTAKANGAGGEFHVMGAGELERMVKRR